MSFLSPGERRFLASLPPREAGIVGFFMHECDAHIVDCPEPRRALKPGETQQDLEEERRAYDMREFGRRAWNWD